MAGNSQETEKTIKACEICDPYKVQTPGIARLHKPPSLWRGKHRFQFDMSYNPAVLHPYFQDRYTNIHTHGWVQHWTNETQQKHDDYFGLFLHPPFPTPILPYPIELHLSYLDLGSQTSPIQVPRRQILRSIALLMCDGQCLPWPW